MSEKPEIPADLRELIDRSRPETVRGLLEHCCLLLAEQRVAGANLLDAHRAILDLLRTGKISEATAIARRVVELSDEAIASDAAKASQSLADVLPAGRA